VVKVDGGAVGTSRCAVVPTVSVTESDVWASGASGGICPIARWRREWAERRSAIQRYLMATPIRRGRDLHAVTGGTVQQPARCAVGQAPEGNNAALSPVAARAGLRSGNPLGSLPRKQLSATPGAGDPFAVPPPPSFVGRSLPAARHTGGTGATCPRIARNIIGTRR
jgi:hypothetical protein